MARVLVVEDNADSREAISLLLRFAGYDVISAADGREALTSVIEKSPDVILLDLEIPEMNGVSLVNTFRSYHRLASLPVIVLTGMASGSLYEAAQSLNASSVLIKSTASFDQIRSALQNALEPKIPDGRLHSREIWRGDNISPL